MDVAVFVENRGNDLTQSVWSACIREAYDVLAAHGMVQFAGAAASERLFQGYGFFVAGASDVEALSGELKDIGKRFGRVSVALLAGQAQILEGTEAR